MHWHPSAGDIPHVGCHPAARTDDPRHFRYCLGRIRKKGNDQRHQGGIVAIVWEGQRLRVADAELSRLRSGTLACVGDLLFRWIEPHNARWSAASDQLFGESTIAAANVETAQPAGQFDPVEK